MSEDLKIHQSVTQPWESKPTDYDMEDTEEDLERWPRLAYVLQDCEATVAAYRKADFHARRYQTGHRRLVLVAAVCGMLAVLFAIMQLAPLALLHTSLIAARSWVKEGEVAAAVVAVVAVVLGLWAAFSKKWLLKREEAERYRFLKFRFLINPQLWSGVAPEARQDWLRRQMKSLEETLEDKEALKRLARREYEVFETTPPRVPTGLDKAVLADLIDYYREKRLNRQREYFDNQAGRRHFWGRLTRMAPILLFFASILAALGHFVYNLASDSEENPISIALIMLAACLPVVGAAVRTLHSAHEFGRNVLRFQAASNELDQLADVLQKKTDPEARLRVLHVVEKVLEAERREWLRLMIEAEWFG